MLHLLSGEIVPGGPAGGSRLHFPRACAIDPDCAEVSRLPNPLQGFDLDRMGQDILPPMPLTPTDASGSG
jgi:hypothetical protein